MSRLPESFVRDGLALAAKLQVGDRRLADLSRDELLAFAAMAAKQAEINAASLREMRAAMPYITRVAMAANEEHAA